MKRVRSIFIAFAILTLSCNFVGNTLATPTPTEDKSISYGGCPDTQPSQKDIDLALHHNDKYFTSSEWKMSYSVMDYRVSVTRKNDELGAMVHFEYVIFCEVTDSALDDYYTPDFFDIIFQYYDGHEPEKDCQSNGLRLYEFKAQNQGLDYNARFWSEILDKNHTMETLLVFLTTDTDNLESYSKKIMPELPSCE